MREERREHWQRRVATSGGCIDNAFESVQLHTKTMVNMCDNRLIKLFRDEVQKWLEGLQ